MNIISKTLKILKNKPLLLLAWGLVFLGTGIIYQLNPMFNLLFNFGFNGESSIFEAIITFVRLAFGFLSDSGYFSVIILAFTGGLVIVSILLGIVFSGGFNLINSEMVKYCLKGGFKDGISNYFTKFTVANFVVIFAGSLYVIFMIIAIIPSLVITSSWINNKPGLMVTALFVDFITLLVLFFGSMFFRTCFLFWYPALMNVPERAFIVGKRIADEHFWHLVGGFTLFDIVFLSVELLFVVLSSMVAIYASEKAVFSVLIFIIRWAFETFFFLVFWVYIFERFHRFHFR